MGQRRRRGKCSRARRRPQFTLVPSDGEDEDEDEDDEDDEEDETAELLRELEKIKKERAEEQARKVGCTLYKCTMQILGLTLLYRNGKRKNRTLQYERRKLRLQILCSTCKLHWVKERLDPPVAPLL